MVDTKQLLENQYSTPRNLSSGISANEPGANALLSGRNANNLAQNIPQDMSPYQKFNLALMDMLKKYQTLGTGKFTEAGLGAQRQQAQAGMAETPSSLIGASPALQSSARSAEMQSFEPQIAGAGEMKKTLSEQISGLGDVLSQARLLSQNMQQEESGKRQDMINVLQKFPEAVKNLPKDQKSQWAKTIGVSTDFIDAIQPATKAPDREQIGNQLFEKDPATGKWNLVLTGRSADSSKREQDTIDNFNEEVSKWDGTRTREQFIRQLQSQFPDIDKGDIARKVYETYPDNFEQ